MISAKSTYCSCEKRLECLLCMPVIPSAKHGVIQNPVISQFVPIKSAIWNYSMLHFRHIHINKPKENHQPAGEGELSPNRLSKLHFRIVHEVNLLSFLWHVSGSKDLISGIILSHQKQGLGPRMFQQNHDGEIIQLENKVGEPR